MLPSNLRFFSEIVFEAGKRAPRCPGILVLGLLDRHSVHEMVRIKKEILERLKMSVLRSPQRECCGLLAGRGGVIVRDFAATNALASATEYEIAPKELFQYLREIREAGLDLMGIYHSHPKSDNIPSSRDVEQAYYPDVAYFILSPRKDAPKPVRAFSIQNGETVELDIEPV
jgi:proteasome lid subunit RPN8/RPN11